MNINNNNNKLPHYIQTPQNTLPLGGADNYGHSNINRNMNGSRMG
jgi:hypothetical protein